MERLTNTKENRKGQEPFEYWLKDSHPLGQIKAIERLADYEDAEEQGLLLRLPCKVGDMVYRYCEGKGCILEYTVWAVSISAYESGGIEIVIEGCAESEEEWEDDFSLSLREFKEQFSASREEAESALAEKGGAE